MSTMNEAPGVLTSSSTESYPQKQMIQTTTVTVNNSPNVNIPPTPSSMKINNQKMIDRKTWFQNRNNLIEQSISLSHQRASKAFKLLLLGAGESGKSTVVKQMRLIHGTGFSDNERCQYTRVLWSDAIQSMRILINAARELRIPLDSDSEGSTPESKELFECNKIIMQTDPVRLYEEDLTFLYSGNKGQSKGFDSMVGSNGVPVPSRNFLEDYVLKYDRRRYDKYGRLEKSGSDESRSKERKGSIVSNNSDDVIFTRKVDAPGSEGEQQALLEDADLQDDEIEAMQTNNNSQYNSERGLPTKLQVATALDKLWRYDRGIKECFKRANEFQLEVNASYYFDKIFELSKPGYKATDPDILHGRIKTTGINETVITIKNWNFRMIDVGGQRSERRKWIHCFDDVTAIVFVAAVSEYDEVLFEDSTMNRMAEALLLFSSICNSRWFQSTLIILFLNKIDKLEKKLVNSPIKRFFKDYPGDPTSVKDACVYFKALFLSQNKNPRRPIHVHTTCATDTTTMKYVLKAVSDMIIHRSLMEAGMI